MLSVNSLAKGDEADLLALRAFLPQRTQHLHIFPFDFWSDRSTDLLEGFGEMRSGNFAHIERFAQRNQTGAPAEVFQIGTGEALRPFGQIVKIDISSERHLLGVDAKILRRPPPSGTGT
ncbi:hypothetical protein LPU83_pLPU83d_1201 (plasmid) [Rhizobium favelukesii]|uniref:Uncharacterized protein n=1 Tax=Rhizobium favelukesii TaxID=348824 RepID=W6S8X6_9HYPH|nr:hypothetical protein LPU83_pLPU83d_1201 [Rhizobium favelukesii]